VVQLHQIKERIIRKEKKTMKAYQESINRIIPEIVERVLTEADEYLYDNVEVTIEALRNGRSNIDKKYLPAAELLLKKLDEDEYWDLPALLADDNYKEILVLVSLDLAIGCI
jgi:hypothetical protein